jgi:hypothetical protein
VLKQKVINEGLNELLKDTSSWIMNDQGLYKQTTSSTSLNKLSGQQNLLLKYSGILLTSKRKIKA